MIPKRPWLLLRVLATATAALCLRWAGPRPFLRAVSHPYTEPLFRMRPEDEGRLVAYARFVSSRWPFTAFGGECLLRSITLFCFLRVLRKGVEIVFGVRNHKGRLEGHAWLTMDGRVLYDDLTVVDSYSAVYRYA